MRNTVRMKWYNVTKIIRGKPYLYRQRSWREGDKVRTQCQSLGAIDDDGHIGLTQEQIDGLPEPGQLTINWPSTDKPTKRNTTKKTLHHLVTHKDLSRYKISGQALDAEYRAILKNAEQLGLDVSRFPSVSIEQGKSVGWRKAWFKKRTYVVTLQAGHRTAFKKAYREALSQMLLEEMKRQNRGTYKKLLKNAPDKTKRAVWVRDVIGEIAHKGLAPSKKKFRRDVKRKGIPKQFEALGKFRICEMLEKHGVTW